MSTARRFDWLFRPQDSDADAPLSAEARFAEALADLPAVERSALALSEIGGLDQDEIAARLGTDPVVVGKLLNRARDAVRASLAANGRRVVGALTPLQAWWQSGASAPAIRAAGIAAVAVLGVGFVHDARSTTSRPERVSPDRHIPTLLAGAVVPEAKAVRRRGAVAPARSNRVAPAPVASSAAARADAGRETTRAARVKPRPPVRTQAASAPAPRPAPPVAPAAAGETIARTVTLPELPRVAELPPLPTLPVEPPVVAPVPPPPPLPLG